MEKQGNNATSEIKNIELLRREAYKEICMENADLPKIDKIITGIANGSINKENLYDEVRKFTIKVTSDHSIKRWQIITEWFANRDWV